MKFFSFICFLLIVFCCNLQSSFSQLCVASKLKVSTISGFAFLSNGTVLEDLEIKVSKDLQGEKIIRKIKTDENGKFSFDDIKSGEYYVIIQDNEYLVPATFSVTVKKKYGRKHPVGVKLIMFANSPGNCSITETQIIDKN